MLACSLYLLVQNTVNSTHLHIAYAQCRKLPFRQKATLFSSPASGTDGSFSFSLGSFHIQPVSSPASLYAASLCYISNNDVKVYGSEPSWNRKKPDVSLLGSGALFVSLPWSILPAPFSHIVDFC